MLFYFYKINQRLIESNNSIYLLLILPTHDELWFKKYSYLEKLGWRAIGTVKQNTYDEIMFEKGNYDEHTW